MSLRPCALPLLILFCFCGLVASAGPAPAEVIHENESIGVDTTWALADGDHVVVGFVTVAAGVTLTVEPGVTVKLDDASNMSIYGTLDARGTIQAPAQPIAFTRRDDTDEWNALRFYAGSTGLFHHCLLEYATYGTGSAIYTSGENITLQLVHCTIQNNDTGIRVNGSPFPEMSECTFQDNDRGIHALQATDPRFEYPNSFRDNRIGAVRFEDCPGVSIADQVMTGHDGVEGAIYLTGCGEFHIDMGNAIIANAWGLSMTIDCGPDLASATYLPVSGIEEFRVLNGTSAMDMTWHDVGVPYVITDRPSISALGSLTIEAGVDVRLGDMADITVYGSLSALGTPGSEVRFTRWGSTSEWSSLRFYGEAQGLFQHSTLEYATWDVARAIYAAGAGVTVRVEDSMLHWNDTGAAADAGATLELERCTFEENVVGINLSETTPHIVSCMVNDNATGIWIRNATAPALIDPNVVQDNTATGIRFDDCTDVSVANQTLTGNTGGTGALFLYDCGSFHIGTGNVVSGNSWGLTMTLGSGPDVASMPNLPLAGNLNDDGILVVIGGASREVIWHDLGVPYIILGFPTLETEGVLTLEPGVEVQFGNSAFIAIYGTLQALGEPGHEVRFTRRSEGVEWNSLRFQGPHESLLRHCIVEHATSGSGYGVFVGSSLTTLRLEECVLRDNDVGAGVSQGGWLELDGCMVVDNDNGVVVDGSRPRITRCSITDNHSYGINMSGESWPYFGTVDKGNEIHGNGSGSEGRDLRNGLQDIDAPYVYWGTVDAATIATMVMDFDDNAAFGTVRVCPWTNAARDSLYCPDATDADDDTPPRAPRAVVLEQNVPNPFNPRTVIRFGLPEDGWVRLDVYDLAGRHVERLFEGFLETGYRTVSWDASKLSSGTYLCRLKAEGVERTRKMVVIK